MATFNKDADVVAEQAAARKAVTPAPAPVAAPTPSPTPQTAPSAAPAAVQAPLTGSQGQPAVANFKLPAGGRLLSVNGVLVVEYDLGGAVVYYDFSAPGTSSQVNLSGYPPAQVVNPDEFYKTPNLVHGGLVQELSGTDMQAAPTFQAHFQGILSAFTGNANWVNDPDLRSIYLDMVANPGISDVELQQRIQGTAFWNSRTNTTQDYGQQPQAEQARRDQDEATHLQALYFQNVGQQISLTDPQLQSWAHQVASGVAGEGSIIENYIKPVALQNPESPWSRTLRTEEQNQRSRPIDIANKSAEVQGLFDRWGLQTTKGVVNDWAQRITDKQTSDGDLLGYLQTTAKTLYPWKDPNVDTQQAAQPWLATYARVLEKPAAGVFDPDIQKALQNATPVYQFEQDLKKKQDWLYTDNAKTDVLGGIAAAGRTMGFS